MPDAALFDRVTLDSSVLLGPKEPEFLAAADLGYYHGYWSSWIVAEFARVRTEWIIRRTLKELASRAEAEQRLGRSRARVNTAIDELSGVLTLVDYRSAPATDLSWLSDPDDLPVVRTALAAGVPGTLVTDNSKDFPLREARNGIMILSSSDFLDALYLAYPEAKTAVADYLGRRKRVESEGLSRLTKTPRVASH